jgi:hypothetical protein
MARRSLRPHLNQIRGWVRQGRTDAWIAHQLEVTVQQIEAFKEEDALIAAELEAAEAARAEEEARLAEEAETDDEEEEDEDEDEDEPRKRRRGRRGGRVRRKAAARELEGTFDHGEEGYGLWLDPAVEDNPVYAEHWAGHRPVTVTIEEDQIVIRRAGDEDEDEEDNGDDDG